MNAIDPQSATRARFADAAGALFRQTGHQKTSVADIARACAMSPANVYRFFASKSAIDGAITHRLLDIVGTELEALAAGPYCHQAPARRGMPVIRPVILFRRMS